MDEPPIHPAIEHLSFLLGRWAGEGSGEYPSIEPFTYREEVLFAHRGKPFLAYVQRTWRLPDEEPSHSEAGYLRPVGTDRLELVLAHPTGFVEIEQGTIDGGLLDLTSTTLAGTPTAKDVRALARRFEFDGDECRYTVAMEAMGHPLTHHLAATLKRQ